MRSQMLLNSPSIRSFLVLLLFLLIDLPLAAQSGFPESWEGKYRGDLNIYGVDSISMKVQMGLDIVKRTDSTYQWKLMYSFRGNEDIRDYELVAVNPERGHYQIDEKNTIYMDSYYRSGYFTSMFRVQNTYIITSYVKQGDDLIFEIISGSGTNTMLSGNSKVEGQDIPEVTSYLINGRQKALLKRID